MGELYLHQRKLDSIFQLLGEHENNISYSMAWALTRCPSFLTNFLNIFHLKANSQGVVTRLQQREKEGGITDIEVELPDHFYIIIEAKRGWILPDLSQLKKYADRVTFKTCNAPFKCLVVMSEFGREYAKANLGLSEVKGIRVEYISWKDMAVLAKESRPKGSYAEKRLIDELIRYLGGLINMQQGDSNWVYVVSLGSGTPPGWSISWIDIVNKKGRYFHPVSGKGWPNEPPNYIAFRYKGKLQSIHHIDGYEVITNLHKHIPEIPDEAWEPHALYKLGQAFAPSKEVPTGNIYPNGRVWCMLDTLFTSNTISEARDLSKKRASA